MSSSKYISFPLSLLVTKPGFTFLFFAFLTTTTCLGQSTTKFADSIRNAYHIPEISYAVVTENKILAIEAIGRHSVNLPDTATLNDRFHIGSNTKAMTAFVIAKFVEKGSLRWTTRFFDIFPKWRAGSKQAYYDITLQDLLSHRAGIHPFQGENDPPIPNLQGTKQEKREAFARFVLGLDPVEADTNNTFTYSNAGYTLAALMLEKVTHKSWEELIDKVFNKDLKLNVKTSWPDNQKAKDTWGHNTENGKLIPVPSTVDYHLDFTEPAGDINIRLKDFAKYIQLNLQGINGKSNYLKAGTYKLIHKGISNYSLGWYNIYENGKELSVHSGTGAFTYFTIVHIDRTKGIAYIIFTNAFNTDTQQGVRLLMRKLKENYGS